MTLLLRWIDIHLRTLFPPEGKKNLSNGIFYRCWNAGNNWYASLETIFIQKNVFTYCLWFSHATVLSFTSLLPFLPDLPISLYLSNFTCSHFFLSLLKRKRDAWESFCVDWLMLGDRHVLAVYGQYDKCCLVKGNWSQQNSPSNNQISIAL